jgi:hypothetical protein
MDLKELIKKITPLYNQYKNNQKKLTGTEALEIIWDTGDLLKSYLKDKSIAPRTLYNQIYGKSEGNKDITQKSYITRDFLDRSYRVRRIFEDKKEINSVFPKLKRYRLFYKAMPFFDQGKFEMNRVDKIKLITLLNSNKTYKEIINEVSNLRKQRIKLSIPHDSKLKELKKEQIEFIDFYNLLYKLLKEKDYRQARKIFGKINTSFLAILSRNVGALASDKLQLTHIEFIEDLGFEINKFVKLVNKLSERKDAKVRRRFRRLIPPEKMIRLSEMIYAMSSEEDFNKFRI